MKSLAHSLSTARRGKLPGRGKNPNKQPELDHDPMENERVKFLVAVAKQLQKQPSPRPEYRVTAENDMELDDTIFPPSAVCDTIHLVTLEIKERG